MLGWSQADLAKAAGLHVNAIRYYEGQHARELHFLTQTGYAAERITIALHKAGVVVMNEPMGVCINPYVWDTEQRPPILRRWERYWKPDSKPGKERERVARIRRAVAGAHRLVGD